jgi:hypothetical protein
MSSKLREVARGAAAVQEEQEEKCELCSEPIPPEHRHLMDLTSRELMCACRACSILFDRSAAGGKHYRLVPDRRLAFEDFELDDVDWANLRIPVDMAFFFHNSEAGSVQAYYPSPAGPTESLLSLDAWDAIEQANPVLGSIEPDVEALLVNRAHGKRQYFLVPIEDCYLLVALIRTRWRGFSGGSEVWEEIDGFFDGLAGRSKSVTGEKETTAWRP